VEKRTASSCLGAALSLTELSIKRTGLALKDTMGYYSVLFTVETKKPMPTASYLK
jgi:hypothetical protein